MNRWWREPFDDEDWQRGDPVREAAIAALLVFGLLAVLIAGVVVLGMVME